MLVLGVLFILFGTGFWLYCLIDAALTPAADCRGLPRPAWVAAIAGTYLLGAAAWFAVRHTARGRAPRLRAPRGRASRYRAGGTPGFLRRGGQRPAGHPGGGNVPGFGGPGPAIRSPYTSGPRLTGPGVSGRGVTGPGMFGPGVTGPGGSGRPRGSSTSGPGFRGHGQWGTGRRNAGGSWLRRLVRKSPSRNAAKPVWRAGPAGPIGPDDDPEFLRSLDRVIRGTRQPGDDPGQPGGEQEP